MSSIYDKYEMVIGLEIHAQLLTKSKAYSSDKNEYGSAPNSNVSPISLGHPGTLPVMNTNTVNYAIKLGLACHSDIAREMYFARKNYFYPDMPKGYQITQDTTPICTGGYIEIKDAEGNMKKVRLTRIHMEEDSGKSMHDQDPFNTLIDLNRSGVPLLEIVSEPDIKSPEEAYNYVTEIRKLVRYLDICDGNMEEGSMRCDANVSVMLKGAKIYGKRCEVKNMNSMRNVQRAIEHEVKRHIDIIESGGVVKQETRSFDATTGTTSFMRSKEDENDYRYFPEPDLQPLKITQKDIDEANELMPPLPNDLIRKYQSELNLSEYDALLLTDNKSIALYFEELITKTKNYKQAANWMMGSVKSYLNQNAVEIEDFPLKPENIADLIQLVESNKVSNSVAVQKIFPAMIENPTSSAEEIAQNLNLIQESDESAIEEIARQAIAKFPEKVEAYKAGNKKLLGLFMGEVMKLSKGKADPKSANKIVQKILDENA